MFRSLLIGIGIVLSVAPAAARADVWVAPPVVWIVSGSGAQTPEDSQKYVRAIFESCKELVAQTFSQTNRGQAVQPDPDDVFGTCLARLSQDHVFVLTHDPKCKQITASIQAPQSAAAQDLDMPFAVCGIVPEAGPPVSQTNQSSPQPPF